LTDLEFVIIDELYFICNFNELLFNTSIEIQELKSTLWQLLEQDLIKCLVEEEEQNISLVDFELNFKKYHYIASKKGLLAHNTL
jgi:hypothetical protein